MAVKYKHSRVGVKKQVIGKSLEAVRAKAFTDGYRTGQSDAFREALDAAMTRRTIKECRAALVELVRGEAK